MPMPDPDSSADATLLKAFRDRRDEQAFTALVRRHLPLVFHIARSRLGSAALAEEAAQTTFARLAAKASAVAQHPDRLKAWLYRTAWFEASDLARKEARLSKIPLPPPENPTLMDRPELHDRLHDALNRLPELDRELVLRHCCCGEGYKEIAAAVGKSAAACQKRVERALVVLGRGLGGAKTASIGLAAFAAATAKSEGLPSASRIAAVALQDKATAAGTAFGAASGLHIAACTVLAIAGGVAGWEPAEPLPTPPETVRSSRHATPSVAENISVCSNKAGAALAPPAPARTWQLPEVLEAIQAGRYLPLVEFLPHATVDDLKAFIRENDVV